MKERKGDLAVKRGKKNLMIQNGDDEIGIGIVILDDVLSANIRDIEGVPLFIF